MNEKIIEKIEELKTLKYRIETIEEKIAKCDQDFNELRRAYYCPVQFNVLKDSHYELPRETAQEIISEQKEKFEGKLKNALKEFNARIIQLYIAINPSMEDFEYGIDAGYFTKKDLPDSMKPIGMQNPSACMGIDDDDDEEED